MQIQHVNLSPRRRARSASLALVILALATTSCSRQLTTALDPSQIPDAAIAGRGSRQITPSLITPSQSFDNIDRQFVLTLAPGSDAARVAAECGAILLDVQEDFALMERPEGDPVDVALRTKNDGHVLSTEDNMLALPAEARQKSWAFDDGNGSYHACVGQLPANRLGLEQAHDVARGAGVLIAVLDTGIDPSHPMFARNIAGGYDFIDNDSDPTDVANGIDEDHDGVPDGAYGHGTHVAGIVALTAPQARLLIVRVLDAEGRGDVKTVAAGIRWAVGHGARVINMSFGMTRSSSAVSIAIAEANARGIVCVAAAGNSGAEFPQEYPALSPQALSVAATGFDDRPAPFTSYGTFVDMSAPGVDIRSAYPGGRYVLWSGTSMAAPFVSGSAALLLGLHPTWTLSNVMARLRGAARPFASITFAQAGKLGGGVLDARMALEDDRPAGDFADRLITGAKIVEQP
jgi:hypothetical protein